MKRHSALRANPETSEQNTAPRPMEQKKRLNDMLRRFKNAQKRARYWSGTPSYGITSRAVATNSGRMHEQYELAMCDQRSLSDIIKDLGGKAKVRDYRREFASRFTKLIAQVDAKRAKTQAKGGNRGVSLAGDNLHKDTP